jgi:hypothetical protein
MMERAKASCRRLVRATARASDHRRGKDFIQFIHQGKDLTLFIHQEKEDLFLFLYRSL